jgi:hypothetical protein
MAHVFHPTRPAGKHHDTLGIIFIDGVAEVDLTDAPNLRGALHQNGYRVTEPLPRGRFTGLENDFPVTLAADLDGTSDELPDAANVERQAPARRRTRGKGA